MFNRTGARNAGAIDTCKSNDKILIESGNKKEKYPFNEPLLSVIRFISKRIFV